MSGIPDLWSAFVLGMALGLTRWNVARLRPFTAGAAGAGLVIWSLTGRPEDAGLCGAALLVLAWGRWNKRGRKAARQLGAKGRAALARLTEKLRTAGGSPLPEGAGA